MTLLIEVIFSFGGLFRIKVIFSSKLLDQGLQIKDYRSKKTVRNWPVEDEERNIPYSI